MWVGRGCCAVFSFSVSARGSLITPNAVGRAPFLSPGPGRRPASRCSPVVRADELAGLGLDGNVLDLLGALAQRLGRLHMLHLAVLGVDLRVHL